MFLACYSSTTQSSDESCKAGVLAYLLATQMIDISFARPLFLMVYHKMVIAQHNKSIICSSEHRIVFCGVYNSTFHNALPQAYDIQETGVSDPHYKI